MPTRSPVRSRRLQALSVAVIGSIALSACSSSGSGSGSSSGSASKEPYRMLMIVAESGALASVTKGEEQGLKAGVAYINAHGGIGGRKADLNIVNDNLDPTTAANLLQQAVGSSDKPDFVFAGTTSNETLALVPTLTRNKILSMQLAVSPQTIDPAKYPYAFSLGPIASDAAAGLARVVKSEFPNAKTVGIIIGNDVNGSGLLSQEKPALEGQGFKVVAEQYNPASAVDLTPQMQTLRAQNPDVLVASGFGQVAGSILAARTKIGWTVPMVGDASFSANNLAQLGSPEELQGVTIATRKFSIYNAPETHTSTYKTFLNQVKAQGADFSQSIVIYAIPWDIMQLLQMAAKQAGKTDTESMTKALETLKTPNPSPFATYSQEKFSPTKHSPILPLDENIASGPYLKNGAFLPVGQTP